MEVSQLTRGLSLDDNRISTTAHTHGTRHQKQLYRTQSADVKNSGGDTTTFGGESLRAASESPQMYSKETLGIDSDIVELQNREALGSGDKSGEICDDGHMFQPHTLPREPDSNEVRVLLAVHLPSGRRQQRHFRPVEKLSVILQFAENVSECDLSQFRLVCNLPKQVFSNLSLKIEDTGLQNRTVLYLEEKL